MKKYALLLAAMFSIVPHLAHATTDTFHPDAGNPGTNSVDALINTVNATFNTAWNATSGDSVEGTATSVFVQNAGTYSIRRYIAIFDTSSIDDAAIIDSAQVCLKTAAIDITDADVVRVIGVSTASDNQVVAADYNKANFGTTPLATDISTASFSVDTFECWTLNGDGEDYIELADVTKFGFRLEDEIAGTPHGGQNYIQIYSADTTGTTSDPYLEVTYHLASSSASSSVASSVASSAASSVGTGSGINLESSGSLLITNGVCDAFAGTGANSTCLAWSTSIKIPAVKYFTDQLNLSIVYGGLGILALAIFTMIVFKIFGWLLNLFTFRL